MCGVIASSVLKETRMQGLPSCCACFSHRSLPVPAHLHSPLSSPPFIPPCSCPSHLFPLLPTPNTPLALQPLYPAAGPHDSGKNSSVRQSVNGGAEAGDKAGPPVLGKGPWAVWAPDPLPCSVTHLLRWVTSVSASVTVSIHPEPAAARRCDTAVRGKDPRGLTLALTLQGQLLTLPL